MACLTSLCPVSYCQVVSCRFNVSINAQSTAENKFSDLSAASNVLSHWRLCPRRPLPPSLPCELPFMGFSFFLRYRTHTQQHTYLQNLLRYYVKGTNNFFCCRCYCFFLLFSKLVRNVCLCEFNGVCSKWDSASVCYYAFDIHWHWHQTSGEDPEVSKLNRLFFSAMRINQSAFGAKWPTTIEAENFDWTKQLTRETENVLEFGKSLSKHGEKKNFDYTIWNSSPLRNFSLSHQSVQCPVDTNKWVFESNRVYCSMLTLTCTKCIDYRSAIDFSRCKPHSTTSIQSTEISLNYECHGVCNQFPSKISTNNSIKKRFHSNGAADAVEFHVQLRIRYGRLIEAKKNNSKRKLNL